MSRFLITTALEETWRADRPVVFLGEWCKLHSRSDRWSTIDAEVAPYHWDDRRRLQADYRYLTALHERLLTAMSLQLNEIHGVDHGPRYWRILIAPWLGYFTQVLFDRWTSIQDAVARFDIAESVVLVGYEDSFVPNDMTQFTRRFVGDEWNHHIYSAILEGFTEVPCTRLHRQHGEELLESPASVPSRTMKSRAAALYSRVAGMLTRDTDAFLISTCLLLSDELRLQRRLGQVPQLYRSPAPVTSHVEPSQRDWQVQLSVRSQFEECVRRLIPKQMPRVFSEGYGSLVDQVERLPWPKRPSVIWTSNAFVSQDVFKAWAADKAERGTPLVAAQHGGHYGVGKWSFNEEHEVAISDAFLTWGWSEADRPKIRSVGQLRKRRPRGGPPAHQERLLLVTCAFPRFSYHLYSTIIARQWIDYFENQCTFVDHLSADIKTALTVRLYPVDYGWDQAQRWRQRFPTIQLNEGRDAIDPLIRASRIYVSTYNATTFLESLSLDIPTVIYWDPQHWELRAAARPFFDDLAQVGVFHASPESAASHVASVWDDVDAWWTMSDLREVIGRFRREFCDTADHVVDRLASELLLAVESHHL